jgi:hypothetical protein
VIAFAIGLSDSCGEMHLSREDMFSEFLIYGMTFAYLLDEFGEEVAQSFHITMEGRTGFYKCFRKATSRLPDGFKGRKQKNIRRSAC